MHTSYPMNKAHAKHTIGTDHFTSASFFIAQLCFVSAIDDDADRIIFYATFSPVSVGIRPVGSNTVADVPLLLHQYDFTDFTPLRTPSSVVIILCFIFTQLEIVPL